MKRSSFLLFLSIFFFGAMLPLHGQPVPPELGGPGFEKIAAAEGWQTRRFTDEELPLIADRNARKGGSIRVGIGDYPLTLRPVGKDASTTTVRMIEQLVYEPLLQLHPLTLEVMPGLASHWKVEEDGQTYWFRINPDARFADGTPVTTDDLLATYDLLVDPRILDPYVNTLYETFEPPEAVSRYIFKVRGVEKNWKNLIYFSGISILPARILDDITGTEYINDWNYQMPPGSGPYQVREENLSEGEEIILTRRKDWWHANDPQYAGQYNFDSLVLVAIEDQEAQLTAFRNGELDLFFVNRALWWEQEFDFDAVRRGLVQKRKIYNDNPQGLQGWAFNTRRAPFNDLRVRQAITLLIDRETLINEVMYGAYTITDSYFPNSDYENPDNPKYRYDPERAAELLKEAGYTKRNAMGILVNEKTGKPFVVELLANHGSDHILTPVQEDLKQGGIDLRIRRVDFSDHVVALDSRNFDIAYVAYAGLFYPNPIGTFHSRMAGIPNTNNITGFADERADELIDQELITYSQKKRVKIFRELDRILMDSCHYALSWYAPFQRMAYWNKFDYPQFGLGRVDAWDNALRTWWYNPEKAAMMEKGMKDTTMTMPVGETDMRFWEKYRKQ